MSTVFFHGTGMYGVVHVAEAYAAVELVGYDCGDVKADRPNHAQWSSGLQVVCYIVLISLLYIQFLKFDTSQHHTKTMHHSTWNMPALKMIVPFWGPVLCVRFGECIILQIKWQFMALCRWRQVNYRCVLFGTAWQQDWHHVRGLDRSPGNRQTTAIGKFPVYPSDKGGQHITCVTNVCQPSLMCTWIDLI